MKGSLAARFLRRLTVFRLRFKFPSCGTPYCGYSREQSDPTVYGFSALDKRVVDDCTKPLPTNEVANVQEHLKCVRFET